MESIPLRYNDRRWATAMVILLLAAAFLAALLWGLDREKRRAVRERQVQDLVAQSYYELVDGLSNLENDLVKLSVSASPGGNVQLLSRLASGARGAAASLSALPGGHGALQGTMRFLNQVSDFSAALIRKTGSGTPLSAGELEQLQALARACGDLSGRMADLSPGELLRAETADYYAPVQGNSLEAALDPQSEHPVEYPSLIYDGPFSDSLAETTPAALEGLAEVEEAEARQRAAAFLGLPEEALTFAGVQAGRVPLFLYQGARDGTPFSLAMTCQGGRLLWWMASRKVTGARLTSDQALERAEAAARAVAPGALRVSWSQSAEGIATVCLIPLAGEVGLYPDMVKVKVALDTGEILGLDATAYRLNHRQRQLPTAQVTRQEALRRISPQLEVRAVQPVLTPTEGGGERLCWEVDANFGESRFFVYLDAATGDEVRILRVIETGEGLMTL